MKLRCSILGLLLASSIALGACGCARHSKSAASDGGVQNPAVASLDAKSFDFGSVVEGDPLKHVFMIKNDGSGVLHVERVQSSCGCTTAALAHNDIAPGASEPLEVSFDTHGRPGAQRKFVTLVTNAPASPRLVVEIKADVQMLLGFEPRFPIATVHKGEKESLEVWAAGKLADGAQLKVDQINGGDDVHAEVQTKTQADKKLQGLKLTFKGTKLGNFHGSVVVSTGVDAVAKIELPVSWNVVGNVDVAPRAVYFMSAGPASAAEERVVQLTSRKPDFKVKAVKVTSGAFVAELVKPEAGVGYEVHVRVAPGAKPDSSGNGSMDVMTNDSIEPVVTVPIVVSSRMHMMPHPTARPVQ